MTEFTLVAEVPVAYDATVARVRTLLAAAGFGVLTEIDMAATMRAKIGVEIAPRVILGACRPELAHRALLADERVSTLLPCNVVVSEVRTGVSRVEVFDPAVMALLSDDGELASVAGEARERLAGMMESLTDVEEPHEART